MATNRSCRWRHTLPLGPLLHYNIGDWMSCANGHPLHIFVFLSASGRSRLRIPTDLLPGLTHDQIPLSWSPWAACKFLSCVCDSYCPLPCLPNTSETNYNYFSVIWKVTLQFQPEFEKKFVSFDNIKLVSRNSKSSVCLSASHSIMDSLFFHLGTLVLLQERREHSHCLYAGCC